MKKTTLLGTGIVLLLVINAATLGFIYFRQESRPPHHPEPKKIIADKLHFDEAQRRQYEEQIVWHRGQIDQVDGRIRQAKKDLYALLAHDDTSKKDSLINVIADLHKDIERTHFKHFSDIRSICKPEQKVYYKQLIIELPRLFGPQKPPKPE
jgi:periplasmic protein CpxP/Spy